MRHQSVKFKGMFGTNRVKVLRKPLSILSNPRVNCQRFTAITRAYYGGGNQNYRKSFVSAVMKLLQNSSQLRLLQGGTCRPLDEIRTLAETFQLWFKTSICWEEHLIVPDVILYCTADLLDTKIHPNSGFHKELYGGDFSLVIYWQEGLTR